MPCFGFVFRLPAASSTSTWRVRLGLWVSHADSNEFSRFSPIFPAAPLCCVCGATCTKNLHNFLGPYGGSVFLGFSGWWVGWLVGWLVGGHAGRIPRLLITQFGAADDCVYRKVHVGSGSSWHLLQVFCLPRGCANGWTIFSGLHIRVCVIFSVPRLLPY